MEQIVKKKKKNLLIRIQNPDEKEVHRDIDELAMKIIRIFKWHIGKANSISSYDLFQQLFGASPESIDIFQRGYLWLVVKSILHRLRYREELFVVNSGSNYYVLQSKEELYSFNKKMDTLIDNLKNTKRKADKWVMSESWRKI